MRSGGSLPPPLQPRAADQLQRRARAVEEASLSTASDGERVRGQLQRVALAPRDRAVGVAVRAVGEVTGPQPQPDRQPGGGAAAAELALEARCGVAAGFDERARDVDLGVPRVLQAAHRRQQRRDEGGRRQTGRGGDVREEPQHCAAKQPFLEKCARGIGMWRDGAPLSHPPVMLPWSVQRKD